MASKSYNYALTEAARNDIDEVLEYIVVKLGNLSAAKALAEEFDAQIENICLEPRSGKLVENEFLKRDDIRRFLVKKFVGYYLVDGDAKQIVILRFVYGRRNQDVIVDGL